jgi:hypothetical protein
MPDTSLLGRLRNLDRRAVARVSLGLSLLFAVGAFVVLSLLGRPVAGAALGALSVFAGLFEYRRTMQDIVSTERFEAEAEASQRRDRQ